MWPEALAAAINALADFVFGPWTLALFFGTGIFLTLRYRFVQVTHLGRAIRATVRPPVAGPGALTPFQSFATALAASIGTGNIAGVATAIASGGPGALFWIWAYGFFATAIKFTEATLGALYRTGDERTLSCGPTRYLAVGLGMPRVAWTYAMLAGIAALVATPLAQSNSIAVVMQSEFDIPPLWSGSVLALLAAAVVLGGVTTVGRTSQALAPLKVLLYLGGGAVVLVTFRDRLPEVLAAVVREAFSLEAAGGGALGLGMLQAMRYGVARGIYANEAGYGSAAIAYGAAKSASATDQGLCSILEVYIVSFLTSSVSGLCVLVSGALPAGRESAAAVAFGFESAMPGFGGAVVAACTLLFGYTTLVGWCFFGEQILQDVLGRRIVLPYRLIYCALIAVGAAGDVPTVWAFGDFLNTLMIFPNFVGVIGLSGRVAKELRGVT